MIIILAYHSISNEHYNYATTPQMFEKQLNYLKKNFKIVSLAELDQLIKNGNYNNGKYVAITFDDGLEDNYLNAWPILEKLQVPATIFMTTELAGKDIINTSKIKFNFLTSHQIGQLAQSKFVTMGSHTHSHKLLANLSADEIESEVKTSVDLIEKWTGQKPKTFAYPKGIFSSASQEIVTKYFDLVFCGKGIIFDDQKAEAKQLPRIIVYNDSFFKFKLILTSWYQKLVLLKMKLKK